MRRAALGLLSAAALLGACGEPVSAPTNGRVALAIAPRWPAAVMANAVFGAAIDSVYVIAYRPNESTAAERTIAFPRDQEGLRFGLDIPLVQRVETLYLYVEMREGATTTYYGYGDAVVVRAGSIPSAPAIPLQYSGPGFDAAFVTITPRVGNVQPQDTVQFSAVVQNGQQQIVAAPIAWSLSDSSLARIDATGRFISRGGLGTVRVRATTPTGVADSISVTVSPQVP